MRGTIGPFGMNLTPIPRALRAPARAFVKRVLDFVVGSVQRRPAADSSLKFLLQPTQFVTYASLFTETAKEVLVPL